ncbi:hypothetical protein [Hydrogenophaga sp.]|uniref:hypothetical protein n=1 Tax=Hydrogenophaga sp. TaxID=1904254 RepID=UPI00272F62EA|nr:hypothetical protein [Hydrogenophaga sp.]MDP2017844.1 hypothetical protein [Hydrogenophaga sp.]
MSSRWLPPSSSSFDRRDHGRLGGMPVTMRLEPLRDGVDTHGWYAYDKYRTPIALAVRQEGSDVHAVELTESQGRLERTSAGGSLIGTWLDKEGRQRLPVIFQ